MKKKYKGKQQARVKTGKGAGKAIAALVVSAVMLIGGGAVGMGYGTQWTYKRGNAAAAQPNGGHGSGAEDANNQDRLGGAVLTPGEEDGGIQISSRKLKRAEYAANGIPRAVDSAATITVHVYPEFAIDKQIDCTIAWKNAACKENVNDYYSVTPTTTDPLTFNAVCKKPFDEVIIITFASRANSSVKKTVQVDYVSKLDFTLTLDYNGDPVRVFNGDSEFDGCYFANWSKGTIKHTSFEITKVQYKLNDEFVNVVQENWDYFPDVGVDTGRYEVNTGYIDITLGCGYLETEEQHDSDECYGDALKLYFMDNYLITARGDAPTAAEKYKVTQGALYMLYNYYVKNGDGYARDAVTYRVEYTYTLGGETYTDTYEELGDFNLEGIEYYLRPDQLGTDKDNIKH